MQVYCSVPDCQTCVCKLSIGFITLFIPYNECNTIFSGECDSKRAQLNYFWRPCTPEYVIYEQETQSYSKGWTPYNQSEEDLQSSFWIYEDSSQTKAMPIIGHTAIMYSGGGYVVDLGKFFPSAVIIITCRVAFYDSSCFMLMFMSCLCLFFVYVIMFHVYVSDFRLVP